MMCELTVYDFDGNSIEHFTQWDSNQKIIIEGTQFSSAPEVHFYNKNNKYAYVMKSEIVDEWRIQTEIPNILLTEHYPISIFVYEVSNVETGKTILHTSIPVIKKLKPETFEYVNNVEIINVLALREDLIQLYDEVSESEKIRIENENTRIVNEDARQENENERSSNENTRIVNEDARQENEQKRVEETEELISELKSSIENAKQLVNVANNLTTTTEGYVLDARQGAVLNTSITSLDERITSLEGRMVDEVTSSDIDKIVV